MHEEATVQAAAASLQDIKLDEPMAAAPSQHTTPKLPIPGQRNILITSALPYVNNVPHLGNIIGCVLSADVYARYCRARGYNCIYICGTDEYGTATETKALEEGLACHQICDKYHDIHKAIYQWFNISFDKFGRTSTAYQTKIAQDIFTSLHENGYLVEKSVEQLYSLPLEKFLADRFVVGTCPKCKYEDARGDQCDGCGALLNPVELINPRCKITGSTPVIRQTNHIFLDLPQLSDELQQYIDATSTQGGWSSNCVQVTKAWMRDGLKLRAITRDLKWGTQVPLEGFKEKVFYVWFDAPIGYISITASYCDDWEAWWKNNKDVELVQFMGKDNVVFHTVIFPASLLGSRQPWTLMKSISVTEYLNYEAGKFSKTHGTGVFGNDAIETGIPSDVWRYYLLATRPEKSDTEFNWVVFKDKFTADLNDNLGNFVNRVLKFIHNSKFFAGVIPPASSKGEAAVLALGEKVGALMECYCKAMEAQKIKEGIETAMRVSAAGNLFLTENELWNVIKRDKEECGTMIAGLGGVVVMLAAMLSPFIPVTAQSMLKQLGLGNEWLDLTEELVQKSKTPHLILAPGHKMDPQVPQPLFSKKTLDDDVVVQLRGRFSGKQEVDAAAAPSTAPSTAGKTKKGGDGKSKKGGDKAGSQGKKSTDNGKKEAKSKKSKAEKAKVDAAFDGEPAKAETHRSSAMTSPGTCKTHE